MINLIKMNLYKMFHTKAMWITLLCCLAFVSLIYYVGIKFEEDSFDEHIEETVQEDATQGDEIAIGITSGLSGHEKAGVMDHLLDDMCNAMVLLFLVIAVCLFVHGDQKSGYIKNIAGQCKHKSYIFLSKLVCIACYEVVFYVIYFAYITLYCKILSPNMGFAARYTTMVPERIAVAALVSFAYLVGAAALTSILKSGAVAMTLCIAFLLGFEQLIIDGLDALLDTNMYKYAPINVLTDIPYVSDFSRAIGVGVVLFVVYNVIGALVIEKRDAV